MAIYELMKDAIRPIEETSFAKLGVNERADLQRLLRSQIGTISPDTLVIAEEFGEWEDSKRRIDLLALDKDANLVVIELKRTEDGGQMELQAIRYAAMVSAMTFERAVEVYAAYLQRSGSTLDARTSILEFLEWEEANEDHFAQDVRIILVSAEFSKELTTAVMWLNERDLDIRCVRIKPYSDNGRVFVDVQQVIPLPEATAYQVQLREKEQKGRKDRAERYDLRFRFWQGLLACAKSRTPLHSNIAPSEYNWISTSSGVRGLNLNYVIRQDEGSVELYIDRGDSETNKRLFDALKERKDEIETAFGKPLIWQRLEKKQACRICFIVATGGYKDDESKWPLIQEGMIEAMIQLEKALRPALDALEV